MWLYCRTTIDLFLGFRVGDSNNSNDKVVLIRQISHIKSLFISKLHQIWILKYYSHLRITNCVGFKPFILAINLNVI